MVYTVASFTQKSRFVFVFVALHEVSIKISVNILILPKFIRYYRIMLTSELDSFCLMN